MTVRRTLVILGALGILTLPGAAVADSVTDMNITTTQAIAAAVPPRAGAAIPLDYAVVHTAIHDAVQAFEHRYQPYAINLSATSGSVDAAVAKAAHDVLVNRFPAQAAGFLDPAYNAYLVAHNIAPNDPGVAVGAQAAAAVIALRSTDGSYPNPSPVFIGSTDVGMWRPTPSFLPGPPPSFSSMAVPWYATVTPFTLTGPSQFRPATPPGPTSGLYTKDYKEIKRLGSDVNSERTPEQTYVATFWAMNFGVQWNVAARDIVAAHVSSIGDSARLFALVNMAMADAAIGAWDCKVTYPFWRPITAIQEGDNDGNKHTEGDVNWRPFINTPNYPDPCSGANGVSAAASKVLALVLGTDHFSFVMTSNNPAAVPPTHTYTRFSDASRDVRDARVYQGIHFRFADVAGRKIGLAVAKQAFHNVLRPVGGGEDEGDNDDGDDD